MPKITFLGGCREVGRSGVLIESNNGSKCILDYGIRFKGKERLPYEVETNNIKAVALSHCHIDHSGALPFLYKTHSIPFFTNPVSLAISEVLIKDMIRISNFPYPYGFRELEKLKQNAHFLENHHRQKIGDNFFLTFYNAGHIPGSVSILVEVDNKKILYSGDINNQDTNLVGSANPSIIPEIDALIVESTYALKNHPPRNDIERKFVENVIDITENGGKVLIPAFGVARSQEALMILQKYNYNGKIFIDGLAKKICDIYLNYPESLKSSDLFKKSLKKAQFISKKGRNIAKNSHGAIIAPSGMLQGGASISFVKSFLTDPQSAIYLVGYQAEGSPGRKLLEEGIFEYREKNRRTRITDDFSLEARCDREYFDFSSHADGEHLFTFIQNLKFQNNSKNIFCVHGDPKATTSLSSKLIKNDYNSIAPEIGESYKI